jgi:hypothetical protein
MTHWDLQCPHDIFDEMGADGPVPRIGETITIYDKHGGKVSFRVTDVEHFPVPEHLAGRCVYGVHVHAERKDSKP